MRLLDTRKQKGQGSGKIAEHFGEFRLIGAQERDQRGNGIRWCRGWLKVLSKDNTGGSRFVLDAEQISIAGDDNSAAPKRPIRTAAGSTK